MRQRRRGRALPDPDRGERGVNVGESEWGVGAGARVSGVVCLGVGQGWAGLVGGLASSWAGWPSAGGFYSSTFLFSF